MPAYPTADFRVATAPKNPLQDLYNAWQASGLSLEEFKRRITDAAGVPPMTAAPVSPPVGPASIPLPYTAAPIEPPPSYIQQLQGAAFLAPPAGTPEVVAMQREAFNYDENAARAATGQRVIPEMPMGTPEGRAASKQALAGVIPMESVPTAERITEWDRLIAQQEGYKEAATAQGQYWEKGRPSEPSMMDKIGGVIKGAVGGAVEAMPVVGPIAGLAAQGVEETAPARSRVLEELSPVGEVAKRGYEQFRTGTEVLGEGLIAAGRSAGLTTGNEQGNLAGGWLQTPSMSHLKEYMGQTREEAHGAFHEEPGLTGLLASSVADPLTWLGGAGTRGLRSLAPGGKAFMERTAAEKLAGQLTKTAAAKATEELAQSATGLPMSTVTNAEWLTRFTEKFAPATKAEIKRVAAAARAAASIQGDEVLQEAVGNLTYGLKAVKSARSALVAAQHEERVARAARLEEMWAKPELTLEEKMIESNKIRSGGLVPGFEGFKLDIPPEQWTRIGQVLSTTSKLRPFERPVATKALLNLLTGNTEHLTPSDILLFKKTFGREFARAVEGLKPLQAKAIDTFLEIVNAPRAIVAGFDLSYPLRQGIMLAPGHSKEFLNSVGTMIKAFGREGWAQEADAAIQSHPLFGIWKAAGGFHAPLDAGTLVGREEAFTSMGGTGWVAKILDTIPGLRNSERAFITAGNKLRFDSFKTWYETAQRGGRQLTEADAKGMARFLNWATGRGDLGPLNNSAPLLSVFFFAPRYAVSRFEVPFALLKATPYARKAIAKDLVAFYGSGMMILGLAKVGGAQIEIDPRSTEFGKIRIGNTRLDFWGGLQPIARTMAQLVTNQRKDLGGGFYSADRMITLGRFFQGKLSPSASMLVDIMRGETFIGDELTATGASLKAQAFNRLTPMFVQDLVDAVKEWGPKGAAFGILAGFGAGVQTYTTPWQVLGEARDTAAQAQGFKNFADMATNKEHGVGTKMALAMISTDTGVVAAQEKADAYRQAHGGFRPMAEIRTYFTAQQLEDDRALQAGDMTAADWRDRRNSRSDAMSVGYQVYLDSNPDLKEKYAKEAEKLGDPLALPKDASVDTMTAAYFKLFDQYRDQYTGLIDNQGWDALSADIDKFRAQFTSEQLAKLDANIGVADTDIERLYTANRKEVEASGWWAVSDNVWGKIRTTPQMVADALSTKTKPLTAADVAPLVAAGANFKDADAYAQAVFKKALQQTGSRVAAAETLANDPLMAAIGTIISDARKGIAQSNPKAAELAISWGYVTNPNLELLARALAAEGMTIGEVNRQLLAAGLTPIGTAEEKKAAMKEGVPPPVAPASAAPAPAAPTSAIGVPPVLKPPAQPQAPVTPVEAPAPTPEATGGATGSTGATTGTPISTSPAVAPAPTQEKAAIGSWEAVVGRLKGETPYPKAGVIDTARLISDIGGFSLADIPPGLPPEQLKAKLAAKATWAPWISEQTWQTVGALGLTGKSTLLQVFWEMYSAAAGSTLAKTVIKNEDVKRVLDNLSTMGSATTEMYMRAFEGMTTIFNEAVTGAQEDESKALGKAVASQEKKAATAAKSAAKKGAAAAEKEAEVAAEKLSWERLAEELGG